MVAFKIGGSLLRHNYDIHIDTHTRVCLYVCIYMRSHSPADIVTNVGFNNVHDNNLVHKVLYHTAGFILCGKAGSNTALTRNLMLTCHVEDLHLFPFFSL